MAPGADLQSKQLSLCLMPGKFIKPGTCLEVYNKTYRHWRAMWVEILNVGQKLTSESFLRQDILCPLLYGEDVIGLIACSFFCAQALATYDHPYVAAFPETFFNRPESSEDQTFMSIEYLTVAPDFRKSKLGLSLGDVLLGLSMKVFEEIGSTFVLGTARSKIHVDDMCYQFGFSPLGTIDKFGHPCTLIVNDKSTLRTHPDPRVRDLINHIWSKRTSLFDRTYIENFKLIA